MKGSDKIEYIYFDVDNLKILSTLSKLQSVYYKGEKRIHEYIYNHFKSGQTLHAMSSTQESEITLRVKLIKMQRKEQNDICFSTL